MRAKDAHWTYVVWDEVVAIQYNAMQCNACNAMQCNAMHAMQPFIYLFICAIETGGRAGRLAIIHYSSFVHDKLVNA